VARAHEADLSSAKFKNDLIYTAVYLYDLYRNFTCTLPSLLEGRWLSYFQNLLSYLINQEFI